MKKTTLVTAALLALALIAGTTALTGCLDPHDTHVHTRAPLAR